MTITPGNVELVQGVDENGRDFGYVDGDDGGGFFFTWHDTLDQTLQSIDIDAVDGPGGLDESDVYSFLCDYLPTTPKGRLAWGERAE